eukprot:COSAG05_NODE_9329_length_631_cov_1.765038_2_plen_63_part_01
MLVGHLSLLLLLLLLLPPPPLAAAAPSSSATASPTRWLGPFTNVYSDRDCPNLGNYQNVTVIE